MTGIAVLLVVISAFTHAAWNLVGKRRHPSAGFFVTANLAGTVLLVPVLVLFAARLDAVPAPVWRFLVVTGFFQCLYYVSLAAAYRKGDMSVAYPVARSLPVLLTTALVVMGRGSSSFSYLYSSGCLLVVGGILLLALGPPPGNGRRRLGAWVAFAILAAAGTTGYSFTDGEALALLRANGAGGASSFSAVEAGILYLSLEAVSSTVWMLLFVVAVPRERRELAGTARRSWPQALLMGAGIYVTYGLVLVAMSFARNVGYVVAFRQLSVPLGAVVAMLVLREPASPARLSGIAVASAGLVLVALG